MSTETPTSPLAVDTEHGKGWTRERIVNLVIRNSMVIVLLLVMAYFAPTASGSSASRNARTILIAAAPFALIALGQTLVILTGGIDLSVGCVIAVSAMSAACGVRQGQPRR